MGEDAIFALIPIVAIGGFFGWMITLTLTRAQSARLKAQSEAWQKQLAKRGVQLDLVFVSLDDDERQLRRFLEGQPKGGLRASYWLPEGDLRSNFLVGIGKLGQSLAQGLEVEHGAAYQERRAAASGNFADQSDGIEAEFRGRIALGRVEDIDEVMRYPAALGH